MTPEEFDNLPGWAQSEFRELKRCLMAEALARKSAADVVTESPVSYVQSIESIPGGGAVYERRYVQANCVTVEGDGVTVQVWPEDGIRITALATDGGPVLWYPMSSGSIKLVRR